MKKFLSIILALVSVICVSFALGGCNNKTIDKQVVVRGQYYDLTQAYENGWLNIDDLESIACCYYDSYNEENPYSGKFILTEKLTAKMEAELKQAFLEQIAEFPEGDRAYVKIMCYFGTYNGNAIVRLFSDYVCEDPIIKEEFYIGGVLFKNFWLGDIRVYHIN